MPTTTDLQDARSPLLVNKSGDPKHKFTWEEKLVLLDPTADIEETEGRLRAFQSLFAFRNTNGIITKAGGSPRSWRALRGRLTLCQIVRHLQAGVIPTQAPQWVGARSFSTSSFLCIDVDADRTREESLADEYDIEAMDEDTRQYILARQPAPTPKPSLDQRRVRVEHALRMMGVNPRNRNEVLVQRTPSGGFHYYLFFAAPYLVDQYHELLRSVGLEHRPGHVEFFPSTRQGLRLPFGHIPGRPDRPHAWIEFIDRYRSGQIKRHTLAELLQNIESNWDAEDTAPPNSPPQQIRPTPVHRQRMMGTPKAARSERSLPDATEPSIQSIHDAKRLMADGIRQKGTRNQILNQLAAHLIWFKYYSAEEAADTLTNWAMDPRHDSVDIVYDLANGTDKVAKQIKCMCRWYESKKSTTATAIGKSHFEPAFTNREVEAVRASLETLPVTERRQEAEFLLHFLWFAKQHGHRGEDGNSWEASPAVRPVIRRWPGCHHMNYKLRITRAIEVGILEITRDKWNSDQRLGRARTYRLNIPPGSYEDETVSYGEALESLCPSDRLGTPVGIDRDDDAIPTSNGEVDALHTATPSETPHNPSDAKRANAATLHPTRTRVGVGSRPHQRNQEPDAAPDLPRANHGGVQAAAIPRGIRRIGNHQAFRKPTRSPHRWMCNGRGHNHLIRGGRSPPRQPETTRSPDKGIRHRSLPRQCTDS